jgi:hypothetical protein
MEPELIVILMNVISLIYSVSVKNKVRAVIHILLIILISMKLIGLIQ